MGLGEPGLRNVGLFEFPRPNGGLDDPPAAEESEVHRRQRGRGREEGEEEALCSSP